MSGQSSRMTVGEVSKTIKSIECNTQLPSSGNSSGAETNQQNNRSGSMQQKKAK